MLRYTMVFLTVATAVILGWVISKELGTSTERSSQPSTRTAQEPLTTAGAENVTPGVRGGKPTETGAATDDTAPEESMLKAEPSPRPLAENAHAARAPDFEELLTAYDSVAAATLEEFNARYAGAIAFRSAAEFAWMEEHGFPLPEEVLAAAEMSLGELRSLADGGNQSARFLYLDRTLQEVRELRQSYLRSGISPDALRDIPEYGDALIRASYAKGLITGSDSPFAGYLMAEFSRAAFGNAYGYMAGLLHASHLGDPRAYGKLRTFVNRNEICESALHAMGAYAVIVEGRKLVGEPQ